MISTRRYCTTRLCTTANAIFCEFTSYVQTVHTSLLKQTKMFNCTSVRRKCRCVFTIFTHRVPFTTVEPCKIVQYLHVCYSERYVWSPQTIKSHIHSNARIFIYSYRRRRFRPERHAWYDVNFLELNGKNFKKKKNEFVEKKKKAGVGSSRLSELSKQGQETI